MLGAGSVEEATGGRASWSMWALHARHDGLRPHPRPSLTHLLAH